MNPAFWSLFPSYRILEQMRRPPLSRQLLPFLVFTNTLSLLSLALSAAVLLHLATSNTNLETSLSATTSYIALGLVFLGIAVISSVAFYLQIRKKSRLLDSFRQAIREISRGEYSPALKCAMLEDTSGLARTINKAAYRTDQRIKGLLRDKANQEMVLSSMQEGVLVIDMEERILAMNDAAFSLLGILPQNPSGRSVQEVIRNADLQRFIRRLVETQIAQGDDIFITDDSDRCMQAYGKLLTDSEGKPQGVLAVLNDITRLRRLEEVRKDFVANVSHELRTPITSIKGYVETLLDGALENPADARRFLEIIIKQADRLNSIFEDLLNLSRIERDQERNQIECVQTPLRPVLESAIQAQRQHADAAGIKLTLECPGELTALLNKGLLEQAIGNLIDNAIKYSEPDDTVEICAQEEENQIQIIVKDNGCGIPSEHLPRLFERFYRVDRARSRKIGGTGLGLAIVKHIAEAHQGSVSVQSLLGKGSQFSIMLPKMADKPAKA